MIIQIIQCDICHKEMSALEKNKEFVFSEVDSKEEFLEFIESLTPPLEDMHKTCFTNLFNDVMRFLNAQIYAMQDKKDVRVE